MRSVHEKRRELYEKKSWLLHRDNTPVHNALSIREFLAKNNIAVLEQPPYSPDLAPCDFFLFLKLKGVMKGTSFPDVQAIERAVTKEFRAIPKNPSRSAWRHGRGEWKSVLELMGITLKAMHSSLRFALLIKELCAQFRYFSNTPRK